MLEHHHKKGKKPGEIKSLSVWYLIRIPISCCNSSSYSSWSPHTTWNIIQNIIRQEQLKDRTTYIWNVTYSLHISTYKQYLGQIGERRCAARCCFICFLKAGSLFIWAIRDGREFHNAEVFLNLFWIWGLWKDPWWHVWWGKCVYQCCVTLKIIRNFQHMNVSYKSKKWCSQCLLYFWPIETDMYSIDISPVITVKSKRCCSVLGQLQFL
jgi:hypothetical protein